MAVRHRDEEVDDEREAEREDEEADVPEGPDELVAGVDGGVHGTAPSTAAAAAASTTSPPSPVSLRNACSSPAPVISMSRVSGCAARSARIARSESEQVRITASPRRSEATTPGSAASSSRATPGSVARIVRWPTIALISVGGPSATI